MNNHTVRPFSEFIRELAREAAKARDVDRKVIEGARGLLPGEGPLG